MGLVVPLSAPAVRSRIGVVTHVSYLDTVYGHWDKVVAALMNLGITRVRDGVYYSYPTLTGTETQATKDAKIKSAMDWNAVIWGRQEAAGKVGVKYCFATGNEMAKTRNLAQLNRVLTMGNGRLKPYTLAIEGPNEYDVAGVTSWATNLRTWQQTLYQESKMKLPTTPVVGPSFATGTGPAAVGNLSAYLDAGNMHPYNGGSSPNATHLAQEKTRHSAVSGTKPIWSTEWGFHNAVKVGPGPQPPASEQASAVYIIRGIFESQMAGIQQNFIYELLDLETGDAALTNSEGRFGLLRKDFTLKPAATAVKRLTAVLGPDGPVTAGSLDITVTKPAADCRSLLMRKPDGKYLLALWRTAVHAVPPPPSYVWDRDKRIDLVPKPVVVNVTVPKAREIRCTLLTGCGGSYVMQKTTAGMVSAGLGGDPYVLEITV